MQKLFQLIGRDYPNPMVQEVSAELQNSITPFSNAMALRIVEQELGAKASALFHRFGPDPIGAATVGQVYEAVLLNTHEQDVVKLIRPGIREEGAAELRMIEDIITDPAGRAILARMKESLEEEMDLTFEAENNRKGFQVYHRPELGLTVAQVDERFTSTKNLLILKRAEGVKLSQARSGREVLLRKKLVENLIGHWFDEAIFGSGFFHGDLHPGNLFFTPSHPETGKPLMTLIDFGNTGTLSLDQRRAFIQLTIGSISNSPRKVVEALESLDPSISSRLNSIESGLQTVLEGHPDANTRLAKIVEYSVKSGVQLPKGILSFQRGKAFLEKEANAINLLLPAGHERIDPAKIYLRHALKQVGKSLPKQLFSKLARETAVFRLTDLLDLALAYEKQILQSVYRCVNSLLPFARQKPGLPSGP